jgi:hypothetical protein
MCIIILCYILAWVRYYSHANHQTANVVRHKIIHRFFQGVLYCQSVNCFTVGAGSVVLFTPGKNARSSLADFRETRQCPTSCCAELYSDLKAYRTLHAESMVRNSFTPVSKV